MKRYIKSFICVLMVSMIALPAGISAYAEESGDYKYTTGSNGNAVITGYTGTDTDVVVPSSLDGFPVEEIGRRAFAGNKTIKSITVSEGITVINSSAFSGCSNLQKAVLPEGLLELKDCAFQSDRNLETINFPSTLTTIGASCFYDDLKLTKAVIPGGVKILGENAFRFCNALTEITIEEGVEEIKSGAFYECPKVSKLVLPSTMKIIGRDALVLSANLTYIIVPDGIESIGSQGIGFRRTFVFENDDDPYVVPVTDLVLYGKPGSVAEAYAKQNAMTFKDSSELFNVTYKGASLRVNNPGMRFGFSLECGDLALEDAYESEIGFLYSYSESSAEKLTLENRGKEGVNKIIAVNSSESGNIVSYNLVFTKIPKESYAEKISVRGYAVIDGRVYYTEPATDCLNDIAQRILSDDKLDGGTKDALRKTFDIQYLKGGNI